MTDDCPAPMLAAITDAITDAETHLQAARAALAQPYDGTHVDTRHLVAALFALRRARNDINTATAHATPLARDLAVPWSAIGYALDITRWSHRRRPD